MKEASLIITPGFPADENDTTCLPAFQQFALTLKKASLQQEIIVLSFQYPYRESEYYWHGIKVIALGGENRGKLYRARTWWKSWRALKKINDHYRLSGIVSLWITECALLGNRFAKKHSIPHMIWIIGQDAKAGNNYVKRIGPAPEQLMAMSDFLQEEFFKNYGIKPAQVIENGINEKIFPAYNTSHRPIDIFGAGSLIPLKNYALFIQLIAGLRTKFPAIKAVIAGSGEERAKLQTLIEELNLQNNITLVGLKTHTETLELMSQSKVFLHTSVYEGNSTVLMEALYSGCQVVSTCPLSNGVTEHLFVSTAKNELLAKLTELFSGSSVEQNRVVFNTMDDSVKRIMQLLAR